MELEFKKTKCHCQTQFTITHAPSIARHDVNKLKETIDSSDRRSLQVAPLSQRDRATTMWVSFGQKWKRIGLSSTTLTYVISLQSYRIRRN